MDLLKQIFSPEPPKELQRTEEEKKGETKREEEFEQKKGEKKEEAMKSKPEVPTTKPEPTSVTQIGKKGSKVVKREIECEPVLLTEQIKQLNIDREQPVVHLEREQIEVKQIVQPLIQREITPAILSVAEKVVDLGTKVEGTLPPELPDVVGDVQPKVEFVGVEHEKQVLPPIIEETVHKKIIEHIQPVVHKEKIIPHILETTTHIHETVKEKPIYTHETREPVPVEKWVKQEGVVCTEPHPHQRA